MQPGFDRTNGNSFRPPASPRGSSDDFLGLEDELSRRGAEQQKLAETAYAQQQKLAETAYAVHYLAQQRAGLQHVEQQYAAPHYTVQHVAAQQHVASQYAAQQYAAPQYAAPPVSPQQHAAQHHAPQQYAAPQHAAQQHGAQPYVEQSHGMPQAALPQQTWQPQPHAQPRPQPQHSPHTPSVAYPHAAPGIPAREQLAPGAQLAANWPPVAANTWRVQPPAEPVARAADRPSWLLELDDSAVPPAHPTFVANASPLNASYRDGTETLQRVAPWFVRSLCVFAGLFLCAVITRTILARNARPPLETQEPVQPVARNTAGFTGDELVSPDRRSTTSTSLLAPRGAEPESPALAVYSLPVESSNGARPDATAELDPVGVDRWLAAQSRTAAPLVDAGSITPTTPSADAIAATASSNATGVWEGATIPVEALGGTLRLSTPSVGRVRVRLEGGERKEGRLTAIGRGSVWIETDDGAIEIDSSRMRGLEQIADRAPSANPPEAPRRQRVRTAGGVFFGRVLARDGRTVTLITDAGTRLTVEADEISDADSSGT